MKQAYLTPTLLNNWQYYLKSDDSNEEQAKESFFNCLNKIKTEPTPEQIRGLQFEQDVWKSADKLIPSSDSTVEEISAIIRGSLWQEPVKKYLLSFKDYNIYLYGICDCIKADTIFDIKRVSKYNLGKYLHSFQHLIYLYCTNTAVFKYLISNGEEVFVEEYFKSSKLEDKLKAGVMDFLQWLEANNLLNTYFELWQGKDKDLKG